jgi:hypothetical protein
VISRPNGTPSAVTPAGTLIAGWPVMFCGSVLKASGLSLAFPVSGCVPSARIHEKQFVGVSRTVSSPRSSSSSRT